MEHVSKPTALAVSPPQSRSRRESPGGPARREPGGFCGCRTESGSLGLLETEGVVVSARGERGGAEPNPSFAPSPPPPGLFPRKLYQCGHVRLRHLGRLVSRCRGEEAGFSAWPLAAEEPPAALPPGCHSPGRLTRLPVAPAAPPGTGWFLLQGHILSRRRSLPLPPNTHPFLFFLSTRF